MDFKKLWVLSLALALILALCGCGKQLAPVDIDLSGMDGPEAYAAFMQIAENPQDYEGKTVRVKGFFGTLHSEAMDRYYYSCDVKDKDGCCTESMEFILPEGVTYPNRGDEIIVSGTYELYEEDGCIYGQLVNAVLE